MSRESADDALDKVVHAFQFDGASSQEEVAAGQGKTIGHDGLRLMPEIQARLVPSLPRTSPPWHPYRLRRVGAWKSGGLPAIQARNFCISGWSGNGVPSAVMRASSTLENRA